jgi:hypothetical protein
MRNCDPLKGQVKIQWKYKPKLLWEMQIINSNDNHINAIGLSLLLSDRKRGENI